LDAHIRRLSNSANYSRLWLGIAATIAVFGRARGRRAALEGVLAIGATSAVTIAPRSAAHAVAVPR